MAKFEADAKTAGSIGLMAQVALPIAGFISRKTSKPIVLHLKGGTDCDFAPPVRIQSEIFGRLLQIFGFSLYVSQKRNGFFPVGKGKGWYDRDREKKVTPMWSTWLQGESVFTIRSGQKSELAKSEENLNVSGWYRQGSKLV